MDIHVVRPGDTLYELLSDGVPMSRLIQDNQLPDPSQLVVGQTLVIQYPRSTYTVRSGDTLFPSPGTRGPRGSCCATPGLEGRPDLLRTGAGPHLSAGKTGRALRERICLSKHRPRPASSGPSLSSAASPPSPTGPPSAGI